MFSCSLSGCVPQSDGSYAILMPQYGCGLRTLIDERMKSNRDRNHENPKPPFNVVAYMWLILKIALWMRDLHGHSITHRDLKAANIKGSPDEIVSAYIGDFECSFDIVDTRFWRSPEVLKALKEGKRQIISTIHKKKPDA